MGCPDPNDPDTLLCEQYSSEVNGGNIDNACKEPLYEYFVHKYKPADGLIIPGTEATLGSTFVFGVEAEMVNQAEVGAVRFVVFERVIIRNSPTNNNRTRKHTDSGSRK